MELRTTALMYYLLVWFLSLLLCFVFVVQIQELETENTELKYKVQDLENQLRIRDLTSSPVSNAKKSLYEKLR